MSSLKSFAGWAKCVAAVGPKEIHVLSTWRKISEDYLEWLLSEQLLGLYGNYWAFPVVFEKKVVAIHYRVEHKKDGEKADWFYEPKIRDELGIGTQLLVVGDLGRAETAYVYESQWDAFSVDDLLKFDEVASFVTRGADNAKLCAQIAGPNIKRVLLWPQNDGPGQKWALEAATALDGRFPVRVVKIPEGFKDANDWIAGGGDRTQVMVAIKAAQKPTPPPQSAVPQAQGASPRPAPQSRSAQTPLASIVAGLEFYYDSERTRFLVKNDVGDWMAVNVGAVRRRLKEAGYRAEKLEGEKMSQLDALVTAIEHHGHVEYAGNLAGFQKGLYTINEKRVLILESPHLIEPVPGDYGLLWSVLTGGARNNCSTSPAGSRSPSKVCGQKAGAPAKPWFCAVRAIAAKASARNSSPCSWAAVAPNPTAT